MTDADRQKRLFSPRVLKRVMIYIALIYLVWCGAVFFMQRGMMFPTSFLGKAGDGPWRDDAVAMTLDIDDGQVATAWLFPVLDSDGPTPVVMYFHGNGELMDTQQRVVNAYHGMGVAVLMAEYRGYGHSGGKPSQRVLTEDAMHFLEQTLRRDDIDEERLILHGRSLGGAIAAQVAKRHEPALFIAESSFTHTGAFAWRFGVPPLMVRDPFRTKDVLPKLGCPVVLFHGAKDGIIPPSHSQKLHALTPGSTLDIYPDADHNDFPGPSNEMVFWNTVRDAADDAGLLTPARSSPSTTGS